MYGIQGLCVSPGDSEVDESLGVAQRDLQERIQLSDALVGQDHVQAEIENQWRSTHTEASKSRWLKTVISSRISPPRSGS